MFKYIQLDLKQIKYSGDSIGDDVRIEAEALGRFLRIDKHIKCGETKQIDQTIGIFETDQKIFQFGVKIVIIEKDLLFNDIGNGDINVKVDTISQKNEKFSVKIEIKETRSIFGIFGGSKTAVFEIFVEAKILEQILCIPETKDGWFQVVLEKNKKIISLPSFLQVGPGGIYKEKERIAILDGVYRGNFATAKLSLDSASQIISIEKYEPAVFAKYSISRKIFSVNGEEYKAADYPSIPWQKGLYDIEIPDAPHRTSSTYLEKAKLAKAWFRIGHSGERYLHTGRISLGCMTITEIEKWDKLCEILLRSRKGDFMSIGMIEVVD